MAKGVSISIASDTKDYAAGIQRGVIEPTEDAKRVMDEAGRAGGQSGEQLEAGMRGAQRSTEELRADLQQLSGQVKEASSSSRSIGGNFKHSTDEAGEGVKTLRENVGQNTKEIAASFDGSAQSAIGGVQGLVAEFLEGFGPGGLVAGAVLAGGIGLLGSALQGDDTATQQLATDVSALAQSLISAGHNGRVGTQQLADGLKALATQSDSSKASLKDVEAQAKTLGVPFKELAHVYAQGGDATQYALERTNQLIQAERDRMTVSLTASRAGVGAQGAENAAHLERIAQLETQRKKLQDVQKETSQAAEDEKEWLKAGGPDLELKAQQTQAYADSIQGALHDAGADWEDYKTKEGGINLTAYEKGLTAKVRATERYQANVNTLAQKGNADALGYIESLGMDAAPLLQKFVDAPKAQQGRLLALWAQLGKESGTSYNSALQDNLPPALRPPRLLPPDPYNYLHGVKTAHEAAQDYINSHPLTAAFSVANRPGKMTP